MSTTNLTFSKGIRVQEWRVCEKLQSYVQDDTYNLKRL